MNVDTGDNNAAISVQGLATADHFAIRGEQECSRALRYGRSLSLIVLRLQSEGGAAERRLHEWLRSAPHVSDVPARLGVTDYALLIPESDAAGAESMIRRLHESAPYVTALSVGFPVDGASWEELYANAWRKLDEATAAQAPESRVA